MTKPTITQSIIGDHNTFTATGDIRIVYELPQVTGDDYLNLLLLRNNVKNFWIKGVLEQSIHHEALIELGMESRPDIVEHPWGMVVELPDQKFNLPQNKKIGEIFEEAGRALIILGEPGSGKTITLLELAQDLIIKAEADPAQPIPVVVTLSSWTSKYSNIFEWLVNELHIRYQVSKRLGRSWIERQRLVLLLDGLDEVVQTDQAKCVTKINEFFDEYGLPGLGVCSRIQEYLALSNYLKLRGAVCLQPLTNSQIEDYLLKLGPNLASLRAILQKDYVLQELAKTPLMLSVMGIAYKDLSIDNLIKKEPYTIASHRKQLFDTYIERMLKRKGKAGNPFTKSQTINWLAWLAQNMLQQDESIISFKELSVSWLSNKKELILFFLLIVGVSSAIIIAIGKLIIIGLGINWLNRWLFYSLVSSFILWVYFFTFGRDYENQIIKSKESIILLISGIILSLILEISIWQRGFSLVEPLFAIIGSMIGVMIIVFAIVGEGLFDEEPTQVGYKDILNSIYDWYEMLGWRILWPVVAAVLYLIVGKFFEIILGLKIIMSIGKIFLNGIICGLVFGILVFPNYYKSSRAERILYRYFLPLIFYFKGNLPFRYKRFFNYATKLIFLHNVGGNYIFIHKHFLEHFANMRKQKRWKKVFGKVWIKE
jgi:hypothetical protein